MSTFGAGQCPYLATSCPLLKPFAASFQSNNEDGGAASDGRPSPSACAEAHSAHPSPALDPNAHTPAQQQQQGYDNYSVPIHNLHGSSQGYDNQGSSYQPQVNQQHRSTVSPSAPTSDFPPSSYARPGLVSTNSVTTASTLSPTSSQTVYSHRRQPSGNSPPPREFGNASTSPYSTSPLTNSNEPPTPNSFLRSPPITQQQTIPHLQQPVFPHHQQQQQQGESSSSARARQEQQQQQYSPPDNSYATYTSSANYVDGRDYSNGAAPYSTSANASQFGTCDIEDLGYNRQSQPAPQTFQPMVHSQQDGRSSYATLEEVHEGGQLPKKEEPGEQTAFISKLWHLLSHPEYNRYLKWSKDGQAFILTNSNEFAEKVLPRFFRHSNVASFVRQLNLYSFQRVSTIRLLDMADSSTSTSIEPAASSSSHTHSTTHSHQHFAPDSDSEDHHSNHSGGSPGPASAADATVAASGFTHPMFQRDHPELLGHLKPRGSTKKTGSSSVAAKKAAAAVRQEAERRGGVGGKSSGGGLKTGAKK